MVRSFSYGDWVEICRNVPSMPVCSLFLHQQLALLAPSSYPSSLALPDRSLNPEAFSVALSSAGLGVRSVCAIPRMGVTGGYPGSAGNAANIAFLCVAIILGAVLAFISGKRQAAVGRWEMRAFFAIWSLQCLFQLLSTGSFIAQGSPAIVWVTSIQLGLVFILFWTLFWIAFLCVQLLEDGTLASIVPYLGITILFFIGFTYICLDTGFSISGYFNTTPTTLHNNWLFTILFVLCGIFTLAAVVIQAWVAGMFLREKRPLILYGAALFFFILSQAALWALSQEVCISSSSRVDGSFISTMMTIISVTLFYLGWKTVTEDSWDEVHTNSYLGSHSKPGSEMMYNSASGSGHASSRGSGAGGAGGGPAGTASSRYSNYVPPSAGNAEDGRFMQQTAPLQNAHPYPDQR